MKVSSVVEQTNKYNKRDSMIIATIAFVVVTIFSTSSFLYKFNAWVDANCIFTVGKSIFCGYVPYRDLLDHKGVLLHFIFGLGSLISFRSFFGVYVFEVISGFFFLLYCYKTLLLFSNRKILFYLPFLAIGVYSTLSFGPGASAEEFCLPFLSASLYLGIKPLKNGELLRAKDAFVIGILASCVFWIKYTITGLYVGFAISYVAIYILSKNIKQLLKIACFFLIGLMPITVLIVGYFAFNHALKDMWTVYFINNIFNYNATPDQQGLIHRIAVNEYYGLLEILRDRTLALMLLLSLFSLIIEKEKKIILFVFSCIIGTYIFIFVGHPYAYYPLPLSVYTSFSLLLIKRFVDNIKVVLTQRNSAILYSLILLLVLIASIMYRFDRTSGIFLSEDYDHCEALKISEKIMRGRQEPPTVLEYGTMDLGVYTICGIIPECRYFCHLNLSLDEQEKGQKRYIQESHPTYIITERPIKFKSYKFVISYPNPKVFSIRIFLHRYFPSIYAPTYPKQTHYYVYQYIGV